MTNAQLAYGSTIQFSSFTAEIRSFNVSGEKARLEATHLLSPGRYREYIGGLIDPGELSMEINFLPSEPDPRTLADAPLVIDWGDGVTWTFPSATCTNYEPDESVGEVRSATVTFGLSGALEQSG